MTQPPATVEILWRSVRAVPFPALAGGRVITAMGVSLAGYALEETTGTSAARIVIYDGQDDTGIPVIPVRLAAGESVRDFLPFPYPFMSGGLFAHVTNGSVAGSLLLGIDG